MIEMLVVVAVIAILLSILMPSLSRSRESARFAVCKSNKNQHHKVLLSFCKNNNGRLPNVLAFAAPNPDNPDELDDDWYGANSDYSMSNGVILKYSSSTGFLRCPSIPEGVKGSGIDSNGSFDQAMMASFNRTFLSIISSQTYFGPAADISAESVSTPLIVEEHATTINGAHAEGGHAWNDHRATPHKEKLRGSYAAIDGSTFDYQKPGSIELLKPQNFYTFIGSQNWHWLRWAAFNDAGQWENQTGVASPFR